MTTIDQIIAVASSELGKPYVYGAEGPNTFDCSGLMQYVFAQVGIHLPRTSQSQQQATTRVASPQPGDLVFYGNPAYHVGLYIGGGKMIDAPQTGEAVQIQDVWGNPSYGRVTGSGAGIQPVAQLAASVTGLAGSATNAVLGPARDVVVEVAFIGLGLTLLGLGIWRVASPQRKEAPA